MRIAFADQRAGREWAGEQSGKLLESRVREVIKAIEKVSCRGKAAREARDSLLGYYRNNIDRMDYAKYREIGCGIIGSGAIESAHRTIIQKRLKQAGQRWGLLGAQNVLNLRVMSGSGKWGKVIQNIRNAAKEVQARLRAA